MPAHNRVHRTRPRPRVVRHPLSRRLTADHCAGCRKRLHHPGPREWRALGSSVAIRCLDCRHAFCPACARKHFAPVRAGRAKLMNAFVNAALKAMDHKCSRAR